MTTISLGRRSPDASSSRPGRSDETGRFVSKSAVPRRRLDRTSSCLALLPMGFTEPDRSPGLLVSSYLTVSPLPAERTPQAVCFLWHFPWPCGRWALPTIAPCGARTFLPPASPQASLDAAASAGRRSSGPLQSKVHSTSHGRIRVGPLPKFPVRPVVLIFLDDRTTRGLISY